MCEEQAQNRVTAYDRWLILDVSPHTHAQGHNVNLATLESSAWLLPV